MRKRTTIVLLLAAVVASMVFAAGAVDTGPPVYTPENPLVLFTASPGPLQGGVWSEQCIGPF
ncbi:MAG TPA: hypothetical protein VM537_28160, partial [Anaerolineae bacterium]|nr:hypothetical protein [Anaerolineae bacterium]